MKEDVIELISVLVKNNMLDHVINIAKPSRKVKLLLNNNVIKEYNGELALAALEYIDKTEYSKDKMPKVADPYA